MSGMLHHRTMSVIRAIVFVTSICGTVGSLFLVPAYWLRWEAEAAREQAQLAVTADLSAVQKSLREIMERFDRVTSRIWGPDVVGDAVALNERLLRAEPLVAPAVGLAILNGRGLQVAASAFPGQASSLLSRIRDQAPSTPGQSAFLNCSAGAGTFAGWLLAKPIEGAQDKAGRMVVSMLSDTALRSLTLAEPAETRHSTIVLQTNAGCEILRSEPPTPAWQPGSWLLRSLLQQLWPGQTTNAPSTAKGSVANIDIVVSKSVADAVALRGPVLDQRVGPVMGGAVGLASFFAVLAAAATARVARPGSVLRHAHPESLVAATDDDVLADCERVRRERDEIVVEIERLLAAVGHDVRTPVNSILGISELMMESGLTDSQRKWQRRIRASCEALLAIVNGMLETAMARVGGAAVQLEEVDVASLVEEVGGVLRDQAEDKGLELDLTLDESAMGFWRTDPTRLRQVLYNLGGNAIKYTAQGSVRVSVSVTYDVGGVARLRLQVTDTGPGITADEEKRIFDRFQRGRNEVAQGQEGIGLGLTLCRDVASLLGGALTLQSMPNVGSTFTFEVPVERATGAVPLGGPLAGRSALVVGFTEGMRYRVAGQLERLGMIVETTGDSFLAAGFAERMSCKYSRLDLLVLDAALSGLTADALLVRLQAMRSLKDLRSVIAANGSLPASIEGRVDAVIPHPIEARELEKIVAGLYGNGSILKEVYPRAPSASPPRVLVVEDSRTNQALAVDRLNSAGFSAFAASSGREAVEAVHRGGFDVVLMDVQMPEMDGLEATRRIRAIEGAGRRVPIVGHTAHTGTDIKSKCIAAGMDAVLFKPADSSSLVARLRQIIASQNLPETDETRKIEANGLQYASHEHLQELVAEFGVKRAAAFVSAFLGEVGPNMSQLRSALENDRWDELSSLAHRMAGLSSSMGASQLSDKLLAIEASARSADVEGIDRTLREAEHAWSRTQEAMKARFAQLCPNWGQISVYDDLGLRTPTKTA